MNKKRSLVVLPLLLCLTSCTYVTHKSFNFSKTVESVSVGNAIPDPKFAPCYRYAYSASVIKSESLEAAIKSFAPFAKQKYRSNEKGFSVVGHDGVKIHGGYYQVVKLSLKNTSFVLLLRSYKGEVEYLSINTKLLQSIVFEKNKKGEYESQWYYQTSDEKVLASFDAVFSTYYSAVKPEDFTLREGIYPETF